MSGADESSSDTGPMLPGFETSETAVAETLTPLTLSRAGSPANLFRERAGGRVKPIRNGFGRSSYASCLNYSPDSSSWRTCQGSSIMVYPKSSVIFPRAGSMRNGTAYRLQPSVPPISEIGSTYWPTPVRDDTGHRKRPYSQGGRALSYMVGGPLNPTWVEWLMGFPLGWTDSGDSVTPSSRRSRK